MRPNQPTGGGNPSPHHFQRIMLPTPIYPEPVVDLTDGHIRRLITVSRNELTCTVCGETMAGHQKYCVRCEDYDAEHLVPTESYLLPEEYRHE